MRIWGPEHKKERRLNVILGCYYISLLFSSCLRTILVLVLTFWGLIPKLAELIENLNGNNEFESVQSKFKD